MKTFIVIISFAHVLASFSLACPSKFKNSSDVMNMIKDCLKKLEIPMEDLGKNIPALRDVDADDKVRSKIYIVSFRSILCKN